MAIQFLCPNGHKIQCAEDRAGQPAKCPKCGVKFLIPELADLEASGGSEAPPDETGPEGGGLAPGDLSPDEAGQIEFLCPNGHHLHGPRSLEGTPGECPECGVRFLVPSFDEDAEEEGEVPGPPGGAEPEVKIVIGDEPAPPPGRVEAETAGAGVNINAGAETMKVAAPPAIDIPAPDGAGGSGPPRPAARAESFAALFAKLWPLKARGAVVELHLSDGETIVPDRFTQARSQGSFAMLASTDADGKHTLTAVAWDSVVRIVVRGLAQVPDEFRP